MLELAHKFSFNSQLEEELGIKYIYKVKLMVGRSITISDSEIKEKFLPHIFIEKMLPSILYHITKTQFVQIILKRIVNNSNKRVICKEILRFMG